ncbi:Glycosyl transferase, family 2 domain protein, partial [mine drainage metagenome]
MQLDLSILVASVPERIELLAPLVAELHRQISDASVELLVLIDNKRRTTGVKRNALIEQAHGDFVVFVDDDDWIEPDYVDTLRATIAAAPDADCIVFDVAFYIDGQFIKTTRSGIEYSWDEDREHFYRRPNPVSGCYARRISSRHKFLDSSYGEDTEWS